jgi:hypothetical protein
MDASEDLPVATHPSGTQRPNRAHLLDRELGGLESHLFKYVDTPASGRALASAERRGGDSAPEDTSEARGQEGRQVARGEAGCQEGEEGGPQAADVLSTERPPRTTQRASRTTAPIGISLRLQPSNIEVPGDRLAGRSAHARTVVVARRTGHYGALDEGYRSRMSAWDEFLIAATGAAAGGAVVVAIDYWARPRVDRETRRQVRKEQTLEQLRKALDEAFDAYAISPDTKRLLRIWGGDVVGLAAEYDIDGPIFKMATDLGRRLPTLTTDQGNSGIAQLKRAVTGELDRLQKPGQLLPRERRRKHHD